MFTRSRSDAASQPVAFYSSPSAALQDTSLSTKSETVPRAERWLAAFFLLTALGLRCFYIFRFRYDSDEPQHLHTAWGWTQGLVQYRDFFDNHTPLFHLLFAPLVGALGERADVLTWMRFAMLPLWAVSLGLVWQIGRSVYSARVGLWAAVVLALLPWWFFPALEFRTDNLWTPVWLGALAVFLGPALAGKRQRFNSASLFRPARAFFGGFLLGIACGVSMKTMLLLGVSALCAGVTWALCSGEAPDLKGARFQAKGLSALKCGLKAGLSIGFPFLAGLCIVPAGLCAVFAGLGCWGAFYYGVIAHNAVPFVDANVHHWPLRLAFPLACPFLLWGAARMARKGGIKSEDEEVFSRERDNARFLKMALTQRRVFLFLFAGFYYTALLSFWALITRQDYLPFYPILVLTLIGLGLEVLKKNSRRFSGALEPTVLTLIALTEIAFIFGGRPPQVNGTAEKQEMIREVLELTRPGEFVMDFKGESIFRRRAFYYVLEPLTVYRMRRGLIPDTIPQEMVARRVCVVVNRNRWYSGATKRFLTENYLNIGQVRVLGRVLSAGPIAANACYTFPVLIPERYVFGSTRGPVRGKLDGQFYDGSGIALSPGLHTFEPETPSPNLALLWERAAVAGYLPTLDRPDWQAER